MVGGKFYWLCAAENCQLWDDSLEPIHKFSRGNKDLVLKPAIIISYLCMKFNFGLMSLQGNVLDIAWDSEGTNIALAFKNSNQIITTKFGHHSLEDVSVITEVNLTQCNISICGNLAVSN